VNILILNNEDFRITIYFLIAQFALLSSVTFSTAEAEPDKYKDAKEKIKHKNEKNENKLNKIDEGIGESYDAKFATDLGGKKKKS